MWSQSSILTDRKSRFQGHACRIDSPNVEPLIEQLIEQNKPLQRASHPAMYAWRLDDRQGSSDCGESGAGQRLLRLLEQTGTVGVLLVVTRWYGGTPLGSSRFRHISKVAFEAVKGLR